jgi:hypothetical protein
LDRAANVTGGASTPAPEDTMDVERKRGADWPHWPERGNGPQRRDRLERRLFRDSEREAEIAAASETIRRIEQAAAAKAAEVERLAAAVEQLNGSAPTEPEPEPFLEAEPDVEPTPEPEVEKTGYLVFAWTPGGYTLHENSGRVPEVGALMSIDGHEYAVAKLSRSPLPGDERRCAYLEPR